MATLPLDTLWERTLSSLKESEDPTQLEIWMKPTRAISLADGVLTLETSNAFWAEWIDDNYRAAIEQIAGRLLGAPCRISLRWSEAQAPSDLAADPIQPQAPADRAPGVNPEHSFERFVVGSCNEFAHAAATSVANNPGTSYNPLLIYGGTGLGKTHLMHAIGNQFLKIHPEVTVVYVTAEDFMNDMIQSLRYKRMDAFRKRFRNRATLLLMDDIQFLSGKEATQEEFFHTFNALKNAGSQIVLTSDVLPKDIAKLEPRLRTRFEGGLLADIQAPDRETLLAILFEKADDHQLKIPADLAEEIADVVQGNIRELEGILNRIAAKANFYRQEPTLDFARQQLPDTFQPTHPDLTVGMIIEAVGRLHSLRGADILGKARTRGLARARHIAMYLSRVLTEMSYPELAREFGGKDQSTIQHGVKKIDRELRDDADLQSKVELIAQSLGVRMDRVRAGDKL
ncbi:MAG: chromosomal replication initiator protein DnaA [Deltaproteobacteria bacterium]|nr:chromosomal replication initiator protein DnaA [Deltaproteobacteria bacterium]